jgi:tetratricopeptide (TPR) repeat protein
MALQPEAAVEDFREALRLNPQSSQALHNIAHVLSEKLDRPEEALLVLDRAVKIDPSDQQALEGRAILRARAGQADLAEHDVELLSRLPIQPITDYQIGCVYALLCDADNIEDPLRTKAIVALARGLSRDASLVKTAQNDQDFDKIRHDKRFEELLEAHQTISQVTSKGGTR